MPEGKTSVGTFIIFTIILFIIIVETILAKGYVRSLILPASKALLYLIAVIVLIFKGATNHIITPVNISMLITCLFGMSIRSYLKNMQKVNRVSILLWIQNFAGLQGSIAYFYVVINNPEDYGIYSFIFWILNLASYAITCIYVYMQKESNSSYIFPGFGVFICLVYLAIISYFAM